MPSDPKQAGRPRLTPAIADVRRAVRGVLEGLGGGADGEADAGGPAAPAADAPLVLVALSGGPDSLALAAGAAFEAPRAGLRAGAVIVDHGLQDGSADAAEAAANQARALGLDPVVVRTVEVAATGDGPEASARTARYAALDAVARETGAVRVLLGHTLDDQAETVLLGLARGSGGGSLQGMPATSGRYLRPLLGVPRRTTRQACHDAGFDPWDDPQNLDSAYARVRVREQVMPVLEHALGPGVAEALARTAEQLREDEAAFAEQIDEFIEEICEPAEAGIAVSVAALAANPAALRQRIIRHVVASEFGTALSRVQTLEVARLVTDWHGQGPIDLPGCRAARMGARLEFTAAG
ncbi:tRNA(Ile)-lysidine synthase [Agromyces rhizosphaerae]|uniref:tRNA(Ile)-lysidine synthase n=1 Tax=Agromyces rhizosphaerae TaxID=88374 RepID=A0A9W6FPV2_9MICO|nr:tRNA lysidine(34) synthetase TilS [Agromyces rhizosphaerae]GLI27855.1 tRNA(Ile)-lysidine synthase [Agromyces rhizosphaerae]